MIIFTSICANYAHKARTLAKSVKANIADAVFVVCLCERTIDPRIPDECFDDIVLAKDIWEDDFDRFIFKHSIVEASTAVKGQFFRYLYRAYPNENQFVYLDPDCFVYSDLIELKELLNTKPIVLCPHILQPGNIDMEISSMAHGVYNLGFLGVNTSQEARRFIDWWASRLSLYCFDDIGNGIFTDQKWVDLAPCLFDAYILKHGGYDFAIWSLYQCKMKEENGHYFVNGDELRFIHFSGAGRLTERCMDDWLEPGAHPFRDLYAEYLKLHTLNDTDGISHSQWSYQNYLNGKQIRLRVRCIYRKHLESFQGNPFEKNNMYFMVRSACISGPISLLRKGWSKFMRSCSEDGFRASVRKVIQKVRKRILQ